MIFYTSPAMLAIFAAIIALQLASALSSGKLSAIFTYVNISLHIAFIPIALFAGAKFAELVALFMLSLATLMIASYIKHLIKKPHTSAGEEEEVDKHDV